MKQFILLFAALAITALALENSDTHEITCNLEETVIRVKKSFFDQYYMDGNNPANILKTGTCESSVVPDASGVDYFVITMDRSKPFDCATNTQIADGHLTLEYNATIDLQNSDTMGIINRGQLVELAFECKYDLLQGASSSQHLKSLVVGSTANKTVGGATDLKLGLDLFADGNFENAVTAEFTPVGGELFIGVANVSDSVDANVQLYNCIGSFMGDDDEYKLVDDSGCSTNGDLVTVEKNYEGAKAGFKIKSFYPPAATSGALMQWQASEETYRTVIEVSCWIKLCPNTDNTCPALSCAKDRKKRDLLNNKATVAKEDDSFRSTFRYNLITQNDEKCKEKSCSHVCFLDENQDAACLCPEGSQLDDSNNCVSSASADTQGKVYFLSTIEWSYVSNRYFLLSLVGFSVVMHIIFFAVFCCKRKQTGSKHPLIKA